MFAFTSHCRHELGSGLSCGRGCLGAPTLVGSGLHNPAYLTKLGGFFWWAEHQRIRLANAFQHTVLEGRSFSATLEGPCKGQYELGIPALSAQLLEQIWATIGTNAGCSIHDVDAGLLCRYDPMKLMSDPKNPTPLHL